MVAKAAGGLLSKYFSDVGDMAYTRREIAEKMRPMNKSILDFVNKNLDDEDAWGMGKIAKAAVGKIHRSSSLFGAVYGGAAGGVMGLTSGDRDTGFWQGATMGAISGARGMRGGISQRAMGGAIAGAAYAGFSNDTSIVGGAFTGAALAGTGMKYGRGFNAIRKMGRKGQWGKGLRTAGRATAHAIKKDIGQSWRGKRSRASKDTTTQGSNRAI